MAKRESPGDREQPLLSVELQVLCVLLLLLGGGVALAASGVFDFDLARMQGLSAGKQTNNAAPVKAQPPWLTQASKPQPISDR